MRAWIFLSILSFCLSVQAEYRVFRLMITPRTPASAPPATTPPPAPAGKEVISTLDPDQYRGYYHLHPEDVVTYTQTWMCKDNTGNFKETCPAPLTSSAPANP